MANDEVISVSNNVINSDGSTAIHLRGSDRVLIDQNVINNSSFALSIGGTNNCQIRDNQIHNGLMGSSATGSLGNLFCCNNISSSLGMWFSGQCDMTDLHTNSYPRLLLAGKIGPQPNHGNLWANQNGQTYAEISTNDPDQYQSMAENSPFRINPDTPGAKPDAILPSLVEEIWFPPTGSPTPTCSSSPDCGVEPYEFTTSDPPSTPNGSDPCEEYEKYVQSIKGPKLGGNYKDQNDWLRDYYVYQYFSRIPRYVWEDCTIITDFMDSTIVIPDYVETEHDVNDVYVLSPSQQATVDQTNDDLTQALDALSQIYASIEDDTEYEANQAQIISLQTQIHQYSTVLDGMIAQLNSQASMMYPALLTDIQGLPSTLHFHDDLKYAKAKEVEVRMNGKESVSSTEWDALRLIANKCPLDYGQAVYEAQSLLALIGEHDFSDEETTCANPTPRALKVADDNDELEIYPNPSSGLYNIHIGNGLEGSVLRVTNSLGKVIYTIGVVKKEGQLILDISDQNSGVYFVSAMKGDKTVYQGRILLVK